MYTNYTNYDNRHFFINKDENEVREGKREREKGFGSCNCVEIAIKSPIFKRSNYQKVQLSKGPIIKRFNYQKVQYSKGPMSKGPIFKRTSCSHFIRGAIKKKYIYLYHQN